MSENTCTIEKTDANGMLYVEASPEAIAKAVPGEPIIWGPAMSRCPHCEAPRPQVDEWKDDAIGWQCRGCWKFFETVLPNRILVRKG